MKQDNSSPAYSLWGPRTHCAGKTCYGTKKDATTVMRQVMSRRRNRPRMIRAYWCHRCEAWHLTKKELR